MGIFGAIQAAIFGSSAAPAASTGTSGTDGPAWAGVASQATAQTKSATVTGSLQPVDVEAKLRERMAAKGNPDLNYQSSIVDLMKLLDLDSSLAARSQLADELGYVGAKDGSAEMNIWLHRRVVEELEKNGGRVPESMKA